MTEMTLAPGEVLRVDTGCLVAMDPQVDYDVEMVPGIKTALFGGEGLFFVKLTGPGRVILQTLPFSRLADRIIAASPRSLCSASCMREMLTPASPSSVPTVPTTPG